MVWHTVPPPVKWMFPRRIWEGDPQDRSVYLTFDDGPVPDITDYILELLSQRGQCATFFMVGDNVRKHPQVARQVLDAGHRIGNHTYHHLNGFKTHKSVYLEDVKRCDQVLEEELGIKTALFRPPYGMMTSAQAGELALEKRLVMWSVLSRDYVQGISPGRVFSKTCQLTQPGAILVFHDQKKTQGILPLVLPQFLDFLKDEGFKTRLL